MDTLYRGVRDLLHAYASQEGQSDKAEILISLAEDEDNFRRNLKKIDKQGKTLLHKACKAGDADLVQLLIDENEADFMAQDIKKRMPLHLAALHGHNELVEKYISSHSTVGDAESTTLLHMACQGGHIRLVRRLIKKYAADINAQDSNKNTPLSLAVWKGHTKVVHELIGVFKCDRYVRIFKKRMLATSPSMSGRPPQINRYAYFKVYISTSYQR